MNGLKILLKFTPLLLSILIVALLGATFQKEGLFYHSFWFFGLIGTLFLSLILCFILRKKKSPSYWLIHLGLIIILQGGLLTSYCSTRYTIEVKEGKRVLIPNTNYHLELVDFNIIYYKDNQSPKEFRSDIVLYENGKRVASGKIMVNHPFSFKGFKFFLIDYGIADYSFVLGFKQREFLVKNIGDEFKIDKINIKILDFLPDFVIINGMPSSRSFKPNNPALKVEVEKGAYWIFLNFPQYHRKECRLVEFKQIIPNKYFSSIEIVKDPGMPFVFIGFLAFVLGIIWKQYSLR